MNELNARESLHQERIKLWLRNRAVNEIPIIDGCRTDNAGIIVLSSNSFPPTANLNNNVAKIAAFIPAAGASTRYLSEFRPFVEWVTRKLQAPVGEFKDPFPEISDDLKLRIAKSALPDVVARLEDLANADVKGLELFMEAVSTPKALLPFSKDNMSFIQKKASQVAGYVDTAIFVTPPQYQDVFRKVLGETPYLKDVQTIVQDERLQTLRFDERGEPVRDSEGQLSPVPAGHGVLVEAIENLRQSSMGIDAVWISNIDNIFTECESAKASIENFFAFFNELLFTLRRIRHFLKDHKPESAAAEAKVFLESRGHRAQRPLEDLQRIYFHSDSTCDWLKGAVAQQLQESGLDPWQCLYFRPLQVMGHVRKSGDMVGGTPCFVKHAKFGRMKFCIEGPHIPKADLARSSDSSVCSHFNPGFMLSEIPEQSSADYRDSFWIVADKQFHGERVYYHETVLYEILGNSLWNNLVFVEINKGLFNPHKVFSDTANPL